METPIIQVLLYFIPALLVLGTAFILIKKFLENEHKLKLLEIRKGHQKDILPLRLQAYERVVLLLERISPTNLLVRLNRNDISSRELHSDLLTAIRAEFDHNISQQVYISHGAWELVKQAKEDTIKIVNVAASKLSDKSTGTDLSKVILDIIIKTEVQPTQKAIEIIKREIRQLYH